MEKLKSIKVTIEVDTTKDFVTEIVELNDDETMKEFYRRIMNKIREIVLVIK